MSLPRLQAGIRWRGRYLVRHSRRRLHRFGGRTQTLPLRRRLRWQAGSELLPQLWLAYIHQQPGQLSGSSIRSAWLPRPPRNDYAEAGDVREATPSLGEAAGLARVLRHASLVESNPL